MSWRQKSRSLPWGEKEIESRDITWIILAASPIFKKKERKTPTNEAAGKLIVFLINKTQLSPNAAAWGKVTHGFFWVPFWARSNDSFILIPARGVQREITPQTYHSHTHGRIPLRGSLSQRDTDRDAVTGQQGEQSRGSQ